ncbi:EnY2 domain-containing protein [Cephalotus follicularis]|uniref:Transcription and mRNA export factor ENY2 n=1 Tax=Cephalotus follicularis TaxID=3775 RepID=A0A1Q3BF88_CEPFO|nr:EnY2 domain-containing protein [Cephalotus follicularis]
MTTSLKCRNQNGHDTTNIIPLRPETVVEIRILILEKEMSNKRSSINRPPTPDADKDDQDREHTLQEIINIKLIESGEKERLKELLRERLIECGWRDEMKALCRAFTRKKGRNNVTVDDLVHVITPKGRASIPDSVKAELLQRIRSFLASSSI